MQWPTAALSGQEPAVHKGVWMVTCKYDWTVFGHIVEIDNINAAKKRIGNDTNKPIDKALKHATDQETPEGPTLRIRLGAVNALQLL